MLRSYGFILMPYFHFTLWSPATKYQQLHLNSHIFRYTINIRHQVTILIPKRYNQTIHNQSMGRYHSFAISLCLSPFLSFDPPPLSKQIWAQIIHFMVFVGLHLVSSNLRIKIVSSQLSHPHNCYTQLLLSNSSYYYQMSPFTSPPNTENKRSTAKNIHTTTHSRWII